MFQHLYVFNAKTCLGICLDTYKYWSMCVTPEPAVSSVHSCRSPGSLHSLFPAGCDRDPVWWLWWMGCPPAADLSQRETSEDVINSLSRENWPHSCENGVSSLIPCRSPLITDPAAAQTQRTLLQRQHDDSKEGKVTPLDVGERAALLMAYVFKHLSNMSSQSSTMPSFPPVTKPWTVNATQRTEVRVHV